MVLNWFVESEEVFMLQMVSPLILKLSTISRDCCRYSFGHVIWADVLTL